jgi:hypothetical protein
MSLADEQTMISDCLEVITKAEGAPPAGWLSPAFSESENTVDLLLVRSLVESVCFGVDRCAGYARPRA